VDDSDKYDVMSAAGADSTTPSWDDWCFWLSAGPYQVPAGDSFDVVFAFLMGGNLEDLQTNADRALAKWQQLPVAEARPGRVGSCVAATVVRGALFLPENGDWRVTTGELLDMAGREVLPLHPGANDVRSLVPGVYFIREGLARAQAVRKVVITR
jgi:hypothetical protein